MDKKIWLISDPHLIAASLHDDGPAFQRMQATAAGKDLKYQEFALRAFVRKVLKAKPAALIITGDLTFNGARESAKRLAQILSPLEKNGISLLVLPGNHDIFDGWARKFTGNKEIRVPEISPVDWRKIFACSYQHAAAVDQSSLAYSVSWPSYRLIMADSNIYGQTESLTHPITNGRIEKQQLAFIEEELKKAKQKRQHVLFFMHHNLYRHNDVIYGGFVLDNAASLKQLFRQYQVKACFSGHIHAQNIDGPWADCPATEVVSSCFAMTDQGYGVIDLQPDKLTYQRHSFDIQNYLTSSEKKKLGLKDFHAYLWQVFATTNQAQMARNQDNFASPSDFAAAAHLLCKIHWAFFTGQIFTEKQSQQIKESHAFHLLLQAEPSMRTYLQSLLDLSKSSQSVQVVW